MLKVGLVGCGTMAESHLAQIERIPYAKLVGVCDQEIMLAKQVTLLYDVKKFYNDMDEMIEDTKPNVIHIVTSPASHYELARRCLLKNINVYIEKPITLFHKETLDLLKIARERGLKLTPGHNVQFSPAAIKMRELINNDYLGGKPCHMESIYCYNWSNENYVKFVVTNKDHWINKLPGKLFQEIISHGIAKIAEYLYCEDPEVQVKAFKGPILEKIGLGTILDELRVLITGCNVTAYFTFTGTIRPMAHSFKVYGPKRTLEFDHNHHTLIKYEEKNYKHFLKYIKDPLYLAKQFKQNAYYNFKQAISHQLDKSIYILIEKFYKSITEGIEPPIPYREIELTSLIMEKILAEVYPNQGFEGNSK